MVTARSKKVGKFENNIPYPWRPFSKASLSSTTASSSTKSSVLILHFGYQIGMSCKNQRNHSFFRCMMGVQYKHHVRFLSRTRDRSYLQLEDGFEESSWWRESQLMQKIYHTYIPFYLWSQHVVLRWFMWSILADRICELISLDVWSQSLHATVNVCRTYYLLVLLCYFSCGFQL